MSGKYETKTDFSRDLNPSKEIYSVINPETLKKKRKEKEVITVIGIFTRRGSASGIHM